LIVYLSTSFKNKELIPLTSAVYTGDNFVYLHTFSLAQIHFRSVTDEENTHSTLLLYLSDFDPSRGFPSSCEIYSWAVAYTVPRNAAPMGVITAISMTHLDIGSCGPEYATKLLLTRA